MGTDGDNGKEEVKGGNRTGTMGWKKSMVGAGRR